MRVKLSINIILLRKKNFPIIIDGIATPAPVEIITFGFSFNNILKVSRKDFKNKNMLLFVSVKNKLFCSLIHL